MKNYDGVITRDLLQHNTVAFAPKTPLESEEIQKRLIKMGFSWPDGRKVPCHLSESVGSYLVMLEGQIRYGTNAEIEQNALFCKLNQFDNVAAVIPAPPEEMVTKSQLQEVYNKLSAQIEKQSAIIEKQNQLIEELCKSQAGAALNPFKRRHGNG